MRKKSLIDNKVIYGILIVMLIFLALFGMIKVKQYIGYSIMNATAGYITAIKIDHRQCTSAWGGFYGMAVMVFNYSGNLYETPVACVADQEHLLFPCMSREENEVYASLKQSSEIDWDSVHGGSTSAVDEYLNYTGSELDSANKTFTMNLSVKLGLRTIYGPGTYTKKFGLNSNVTPYNLVILQDTNGTIIYVTTTAALGTKGFNTEDINYQLMLPIANGTSPRYYFTQDPYEECPASWGFDIVGSGIVYGTVTDNQTGLPIEGVSVYIGNAMNFTNVNGSYNFSTSYGDNYVIGIKDGYEPFVGTLSVEIGNYHEYNFSMILERVPLQNGTVHGWVTDSSNASKFLANVTVSAWGQNYLTNESGEYNLTVQEGYHNIVAVRTSYQNYYFEINVTANSTLEHNISMDPIIVTENRTVLSNGTIIGFVYDNVSLEAIANATVSVYGVQVLSNSTGWYRIDVIEGDHNIVAIKTGYHSYFNNVTVIENNISYHNISMYEFLPPGQGEGQGPGAGAGQGAGQGAGNGAGLGAGKGPGTGIKAIIEQPVVVKDYDVSVKKIIKKLRVGNFVSVPIIISNYIKDAVTIEFSVDGLDPEMVRIDKEQMTIDGASDGEVTLTLLGNVEPGIYEGNFVISGDIEEKLPIYVLVLDKDRLAVEALVIKIKPEKRKIAAGRNFKYRVDLQNMLEDEKYKVDLTYSIQGINNNRSIFLEKEDIVILTSFSLLKQYRLPRDLEPGDYQLKVKADFMDRSTEQATIFTVTIPWYLYKVLGLIPLWILLLLGSLIALGILFFIIWKRRVEEKRRYKIDLDYNLLPKPGPKSGFVGKISETDKKAYFDLDQLTTHMIVAGSTGGGKTVSAQGIVEEALSRGVGVLVFDPTVQWTGFLRKCQDKKMLQLYPQFGMRKKEAHAFNGNIHQVTNARELITFKKFMKPGEINVFVANKLDVNDYEVFVSNIIREIFHENLPEARELKMIMVFDEFHRLLPKYGGTGEVLIQVERAAREFRKWGVGLVLISQVISDFQAEVLANINTQIQMRTKEEGDLNRIKEEYGENLLKSLVKAAVGSGMVENASYNRGRPYFISFRPLLHSTVRLSDLELENYNKYNMIIDDLDYQLEELEKEGVDIFDLKLELKLAQDKVKSGSFNMVEIYLDGLKPRVIKQWERLGKKPKKREVKLVSEDELRKELRDAKEEVEKLDKGEGEEEKEVAEKKKIEISKKAVEQPKKTLKKPITQEVLSAYLDKLMIVGDRIKDKRKIFLIYNKLRSLYKTASKENKVKMIDAVKLLRLKIIKNGWKRR